MNAQSQEELRSRQWPGTKTIYQEVIHRLERQGSQIEHLDTKLGIVFGLIGLILTTSLASFLGSAEDIQKLGSIDKGFLTLAVISLLLAFLFAALALNPRTFDYPPDPKGLRKEYLDKTADRIRLDITDNRIAAFRNNEKVIKEKLKFFRLTLGFMLLGVLGFSLTTGFRVLGG